MDSAIDAATDEATIASGASLRRRYMCATCYAAVVLKGGSDKMRRHFAHAKGEADPDCREYFPSSVPYSGRRLVAQALSTATPSWRRGSLFFDMTLAGPRLAVWIPSSAGTEQWRGTVEVQAYRLSRRMTAQHLERGQLISFELFDGQWSVSVDGEISDDYLSRLDIGANSLEAGLNIFDATQSPGRKVGPSQPLRLGDAVWVLTRDSRFNAHEATRLAQCELRSTIGGWHIFYVGLPEDISREHARTVALWLERRIRPRQARVWIEHPWPSSHTTEGIPVLPVLPGGLEVRADEPVDLQIRKTGLSAVSAACTHAQRLCWRDPEPGRWVISVNGLEVLNFDLASRPLVAAAAIRVTICGQSCDLFLGQNILDRASPEEVHKAVTVSWTDPSLAKLVRVDGRPPSEESVQCLVIASPAGKVVSAGNLGLLRWPSLPEKAEPKCERPVAHLYPNARWLLSVALPRGSVSGMAIRVPSVLRSDPNIRMLVERRWRVNLQPQLQYFEAAMESVT